ncbi:MAG: rhomboid family protein [Lentisphaeria bacterium]|nr:rhomboid family protein [Lentisphaeria bacterium]
MAGLVDARCFHHARREAVACCPRCGRYFCRECITEHEGQVICTPCLRRLSAEGGISPRGSRRLGQPLLAAVAFVFLWLLVYGFGLALLSIPSSFHEGTLWEELWLQGL